MGAKLCMALLALGISVGRSPDGSSSRTIHQKLGIQICTRIIWTRAILQYGELEKYSEYVYLCRTWVVHVCTCVHSRTIGGCAAKEGKVYCKRRHTTIFKTVFFVSVLLPVQYSGTLSSHALDANHSNCEAGACIAVSK